MLSREEILAVYQSGPEAVVALVEQLLATHAVQMEQLVITCERQVADLTARIEQLEARLNKDSHNSHKPPSSDGPAKRPRKHGLRSRAGSKAAVSPGIRV